MAQTSIFVWGVLLVIIQYLQILELEVCDYLDNLDYRDIINLSRLR